jgi:hypothetical protein
MILGEIIGGIGGYFLAATKREFFWNQSFRAAQKDVALQRCSRRRARLNLK